MGKDPGLGQGDWSGNLARQDLVGPFKIPRQSQRESTSGTRRTGTEF